MKILFIIPEYPPHYGGGISTFYRDILPVIASKGHQVDILVGSAFTSKLPSYEKDGIKVDCLDTDLVNSYLHKFNRYKAIPEFQRHLAAAWSAWEQTDRGAGYDLVEVTDWGMLFVPWIASLDSPPTIVQLHGSIGQIDFRDPLLYLQMQSNLVRLIEVGLLAVADELQTYSRANAQEWMQLTRSDVTYIPPALEILSNTHPSEQSINGLVVGRIQYWKGVTVLCEALRLMGENAPTIEWIGRDTIYGESATSMSDYLAKTYPDIWGIKVKPMGTFSPKETLQRQAMAKFIIVPSVWDVFNYTCVEGMAQGKVVLCSEGAGAAGLIRNGINGLTFKANDPQSLATCIETVMSWSASKLDEVGSIAKETINEKLAPELIAQKRIEAYKDLINRGKYPVKPNQWLVDAVSPQKKLDTPLAFLDRLPLRELVNYIINRSLTKALRKKLNKQ
jgi:glycosyltransferase involved in cell wall biosynthesis